MKADAIAWLLAFGVGPAETLAMAIAKAAWMAYIACILSGLVEVVVVVVVVRRLFDRRVEQVIYIPFLRATKHRLYH